MRRTHALALSLLLAAGPAAAQQQALDEAAPRPAEAARTEAAADPAPTPAPLAPMRHHDRRLDVSRDEARQAMQSSADERAAPGPLAGHPWWWLVTAVAVGVLIAVIVAG
jgi:hypothetical protein